MPDFMVKVTPELARALRSKDDAAAVEVLNAIRAHGARIGTPTASVGEASLYYTIENVDAERSDALSRALVAIAGVEAAYAKPADEAP